VSVTPTRSCATSGTPRRFRRYSAGITLGDRVVLSFAGCGACAGCNAGHPAYCTDFAMRNFGGARPDRGTAFRTEDGSAVSSHFFGQSSFAGVRNVAERSVVKVSETVPLDILGPLGCGVLTGAGACSTCSSRSPARPYRRQPP
jgi:aryl-alcohol dehydrogenase